MRWHNNCERYAQLQCVKLILPWSTASMRFCTSELKTAIICRELIRRYPQLIILSVSGLRRQESPKRALAPIYAPQVNLTNATHNTSGYDWHPILAWTLDDVLTYRQVHNIPLHEAYTRYGTTRVSCAFCILSSLHPPGSIGNLPGQPRHLPGTDRTGSCLYLQFSGRPLVRRYRSTPAER